MSDLAKSTGLPVPQGAKDALVQLESQIAGLKAMIPGAKAAGINTKDMEATVAGLENALAAIAGIPGTR